MNMKYEYRIDYFAPGYEGLLERQEWTSDLGMTHDRMSIIRMAARCNAQFYGGACTARIMRRPAGAVKASYRELAQYEIMLGWNENGDGYVWPGHHQPDPLGSLETYETWIPGRYTFCTVAHGELARLYAESDSIKEE